MDSTQQSIDPKRVKSLKTSADTVATEVEEVLAELSSQSEGLQEENQQLAEDLASEREARQELEERLKTVKGENQRLEDEKQQLAQDLEDKHEENKKLAARLETATSENQRLEGEKQQLAQDLVSAREENKELTERLEGEKEQLTQELESAREESQVLAGRLESVEKGKQDLERKKDRLNDNLRNCRNKSRRQDRVHKKLQKQLATLEGDCEALRRELEMCRSAKAVLVLESDQIKEKAKREKLEYGLRSARDLASLLVNLSDLSGLEPKSVKGLKPRSVFEDLKAWMEQATGESLVPFPSMGEMQADHTLYLDPDEAGIEALMEVYDWYPDRPFEGLPVGKRRRHFRVLRRGWRVGEDILIRVQVAVEDESGNAGK
jgi:chromosome segregation ATPase